MIRLIALFLLLGLFGCSKTKFVHQYSTPKSLDVSQGSFLLNKINADDNLSTSYEYVVLKTFSSLNANITTYDNAFIHGIFPSEISKEPTENGLSQLREHTEFDYLVNVIVNLGKDDLQGIRIPPRSDQPNTMLESSGMAEIVIHEITTGRILYSQRINGSNKVHANDKKTVLTATADGIAFKALRKGLEEFEKYNREFGR